MTSSKPFNTVERISISKQNNFWHYILESNALISFNFGGGSFDWKIILFITFYAICDLSKEINFLNCVNLAYVAWSLVSILSLVHSECISEWERGENVEAEQKIEKKIVEKKKWKTEGKGQREVTLD